MKIVCVGLNYQNHVKEFDRGQLENAEPCIFMKPDTALLRNNEAFYIPSFSSEIHHEVELVVKINRVVKAIDENFASRCYDEVGLAIDFTARDLQMKLKQQGKPWELSKAFDKSTPMSSEFIKLSELGKDVQDLEFSLDINSQKVQLGHTKDMLFSVNKIISYVSHFCTLKIGDLILTGTPEGVGKVNIGDNLQGYLEGRKMFDFFVK
ncbi:MAG: fumarylacetoacetate hydrolase family protein [Rikenellaceae bacterium]